MTDVSEVGGQSLANLLATPAPAIGDPLVLYLLGLRTPVLLAQLSEAVSCGYGPPLEARLAAAPPLLAAALQAAELAKMTQLTASDPALQRAGVALDRVSRDQQVQILAWLIAQRGVRIEATQLAEGALAMREGGDAGDDAPADGVPQARPQEPTGGDGAGSFAAGVHRAGDGAPDPIEPGPWDPPGGQPGGLYVGTRVHDAIALHYRAAHPGQPIVTNHTSIFAILNSFESIAAPGGVQRAALNEEELALRPDILNLELKHLYEIKPEAGRALGAEKASRYLAVLAKAGVIVSPGPMGDPGTVGQLPAPAGTVMFSCVEPGVITYRYRHARLYPVRVRAREGSRKREWRWEFRPIKITQAQQQAMVTTTVGGAMLILLMVLLAPVGA